MTNDHQPVYGQPDRRTAAERLEDLRHIQRQVMAIRMTRDEPAFAERFIASLRERRAGRLDRTQFEVIPDKHGGSTLAAVPPPRPDATEGLARGLGLLMPAEAERRVPRVRRLLEEAYGLQREAVHELSDKVILYRGERNPLELANLATNLRQLGVPISANYMTPMGGYVKSVASPERTAGAPPEWLMAADVQEKERAQKKPPVVRVVIIDTGVFTTGRTDGWLAGLQTQENLEDLDDSPRNGLLDDGAGHGSFCAGIVQQIVPNAHIVVCKELDSDGLVDELQVAIALVREVRAGLDARQNVIVNLSFGAETADDERPVALGVALQIIEDESWQAGLETVVVAAAGNFGHDRPCYPAAFPTVTAVAALTQGMRPAEWSSRGAWVDICTIGEGVRSTYVPGIESPSVDPYYEEFPQNAWALWSGTSFAAPQVTGAITKIAIDNGVTPTEAKRRLLAGATEIPLYGKQVEILPSI
jgi:Subtilase family